MSIDRLLAFMVVGMTALLIGGMAGLWLGATSEQAAFVEFLAHADLTPECQEQINAAAQGAARDYEGRPAAE